MPLPLPWAKPALLKMEKKKDILHNIFKSRGLGGLESVRETLRMETTARLFDLNSRPATC